MSVQKRRTWPLQPRRAPATLAWTAWPAGRWRSSFGRSRDWEHPSGVRFRTMRNYAVNSAQVSFIQRFTKVFMLPEGIPYSRRICPSVCPCVRPYVRSSAFSCIWWRDTLVCSIIAMIRMKRVLHPFENIDQTYVYMILVRTFLSYIGTLTGLYFTVVKYNHYFIDIFSSLNCNLIFKKLCL